MANVQEWVAKIRAAVYGKDVRESIAASIEAINDECEEATSGYEDAISQAQEALQASVQASTLAGVAAGSANTAANRANEAAEAVEGLDVSQLIQRINDLEAQLTPETELFWEYEESSGSGRIEAYASACGGMVEYYVTLTGTFTDDSYNCTLSTAGPTLGDMTLLETLGPQFIPYLNIIGTTPAPDSYAATFTGSSNAADTPATVQLTLLCASQVSMQGITVNLNGHRTYLAPYVIYLGKSKSQASAS